MSAKPKAQSRSFNIPIGEGASGMAQQITFQVSRGKFFSGVGAILVAVIGFGFTMRNDVNANSVKAKEALSVATEAKSKAEIAQAYNHSVDVRLARIETLIEEMTKNLAERLTKAETEIKDLRPK